MDFILTVITGYIPDIVLVVALVLFVLGGWRKGLIKSLGGIFALLVALYMAKMIADIAAGYVSELLYPIIFPFVSSKLSAVAPSIEAGESVDLGILAMFPSVVSLIQGLTQSVVDSVAVFVTSAVAKSVAWFICAVIGFVVSFILLTVLIKFFASLAELPGLSIINRLGGGCVGLIKGYLLLWLIVSLLAWRSFIPETVMESSRMVQLFLG